MPGPDLGGALGKGFSSGVDAGLASRGKEAAAKAKAFRENMKDMAEFSDIVQLLEGEVGETGKGLKDPKLIDRFKTRLRRFFLARNGGKMTPRAQAEIDILAQTEINQLKAFAAGASFSGAKGNFKLRTYLNLLNSTEPAAAENYLERTISADMKSAKAKRDEAEAGLAKAKTKKLELLMGLAKKPGAGIRGAPGGPLALLDPSASRAQSAARAQDRLEPPGVVKTKIAQAKGAARGAALAPVRPKDLAFLGLDPSIPQSRTQLAKKNIFVPEPKEMTELKVKEGALKKSINVVAAIVKEVENRPETLSFPAFIARSFKSIERGIVGLSNLIPGVKELEIDSTAVTALRGLLSNIDSAAMSDARIRSMVVDLTFKAGALAGQTARAFSDKDFENVGKQIGAGTANDQTMVGVLRSFALLQSAAYEIEFQTFAGSGARKFVGLPTDVNREAPFADLSSKALGGVIKELLTTELLDKYEAEVRGRLGDR